MKALIIYMSVHHGNTKKIAGVMADVLEAELLKPHEVDPDSVSEYDLIGFGSGIYFWKHHVKLINIVSKMPYSEGKKAFIFSTSGVKKGYIYHRHLRRKLLNKGFDIIGEFSCVGYDTYSVLKFIGGINSGRPNKGDLKKAEDFAEKVKSKL